MEKVRKRERRHSKSALTARRLERDISVSDPSVTVRGETTTDEDASGMDGHVLRRQKVDPESKHCAALEFETALSFFLVRYEPAEEEGVLLREAPVALQTTY